MISVSKTATRKFVLLTSIAVTSSFILAGVSQAGMNLQANHPASSAMVLIGNTAQPAQKGAEGFVANMAKRALDFLSNTQQTQAQKTESFRRLLEENFDMETIGRFTLGRYWKTATPQQQVEYQKLFKKRVVEIYSDRFSEYKGQQFEITGSRPDGDNDTIVSSKILPAGGGQTVLVEWRVRNKGGNYRVVDVIVEGVSMSVTQRSDFSGVIQQGGGDIQVLLDNLKARG